MKIIEINSSIYSQVSNIYLEGIQTDMATFETTAPSWEKWNASHLQLGRIAFEENNQILGWAALSPVSTRDVYKGVAEISVYISSN